MNVQNPFEIFRNNSNVVMSLWHKTGVLAVIERL